MSRKIARHAGKDRPAAGSPSTATGDPDRSRWRDGSWGLLLIAGTLLAYWPALRGEFVFDDPTWTKDAEKLLRNFSGLWSIWTSTSALQQYYPVTGTSFWLDYHLWHWWTLPYHVENVLLHGCSAVLLWRLLLKLEVPGAWLAGALFAVHPLMVESIAWITERKNALSMPFFLAALLAYGTFGRFWRNAADKEEESSARRVRQYFLALAFFVAAILSKITAIALPPVLLLLCWWKRGRVRWKEDVIPTLPFFGISIGLAALVTWLERHHVGAQGPDWELSVAQRILVAGRVPWFYAGKLLWPFGQCLIYPRWEPEPGSLWQWIFPLATVAVLSLGWIWRDRRGGAPAVALFYYVGTLIPVLGLVNFYWMRFSFVGDHLVYLSSPGILAPCAALVARAAARLNRPRLLEAFAVVILPLLAVLTWRESAQYQNSEVLWRTTVNRNPDCWAAQNNLGEAIRLKGDLEKAASLYRKALELKPDYADAHTNLGNFHLQKGELEAAMERYEKAVKLDSKFAGAYNNLGTALLQKGQADPAIAYIQKAIKLMPDYAQAYNNLGNAYLQKGSIDEAIEAFEKSVALKSDSAEIHTNFGNVLLQKGDLDRAAAHYQRALELQPDSGDAHVNLGNVCLRKGLVEEAMSHYRKALEISPNNAGGHNNLGNALAQLGKIDEAIAEFQKALEINPDFADAHFNLGSTFCRMGRVDGAIAHLKKCLELHPDQAEAHNNLGLALMDKGLAGEAAAHFDAAIKIHPEEQSALSNLASILATSADASLRDGQRALKLSEEAVRLSNGRQPTHLHIQAAAYAELGRFADADETAERAQALAVAQGNASLAGLIRSARNHYQAGKPLRASDVEPRNEN